MAVNKVQKGDGTVLIDLTSDTFRSADQLAKGIVGHTASGEIVTGTLEAGSGGEHNVYSVDNGDGTQTLVIDGEGGGGGSYIEQKMEKVCLYYGWPIAINSIWDADRCADVYKNYDICVFGDQYELPTHESYADTVRVLSSLKRVKPDAKIVGYVPIGVVGVSDDSALSMAQMKDRVDKWYDIGANGIFLDEYGYDYGVSRDRQNEIVTYCHGKGMFVIANSWQPEYCFGTDDIVLDWSPLNGFHGNPNHLECELGADDYYLFENMFYSVDDDDVTIKYTTSNRLVSASEYATRYRNVYGTKSIALDGIPSTLSDAETKKLISLTCIGSAILDIDGISIGDEHWGSWGKYYEWELPEACLKPALGSVVSENKDGKNYPSYFERNVGGNKYSIEYSFPSATDRATSNGTIKFCGNTIESLWKLDGASDEPITGDGLLFTSTEADGSPYNGGLGYKEGYFFGSDGGEYIYAPTSISGYMPVTAGQEISFANLGLFTSDELSADAYYCTLVLYDASKNMIDCAAIPTWYISGNPTGTDGNGKLTTIRLTKGSAGGDISNVAYFRISFVSAGLSSSSVIIVRDVVTSGNLLFASTEEDGTPYNGGQGYKSGVYLEISSTSGVLKEYTKSNIALSGYMPVTYGQTITFENIGTYASDTYFEDAYYCMLTVYDAGKNVIQNASIADWYYSEDNIVARDDRKRLTSIKLLRAENGTSLENLAYFRVSFAADEVSASSIISVHD